LFQINELAGFRLEQQAVFDAIHRLVFQWMEEGCIHELRIDQVDGLFEPRQYLHRLQSRFRERWGSGNGAEERSSDLYVVGEKILALHESLPAEWPIPGTTGCEFLHSVNGLFVYPNGEAAMTSRYESFVGEMPSFHEIPYLGRKLAMEQELAGELRVLANEMLASTEMVEIVAERRAGATGRTSACSISSTDCLPQISAAVGLRCSTAGRCGDWQ
jgi:(1->4)-alpha-D-glucan 1-alpha-D-glucosylmutase